MRRTIAAIALALTVVLAGCAGAGGPTTTATQSQGTTTSGASDGDGNQSASLAFYVSDRPGAIEDFQHLNVTITRVGLHHTGSANGSANASTDGTTTASTNATTRTTTVTTTESEPKSDDGDGYWVERDVNETTVDITRLQGENATLLGNLSVPAGSYDKVFLYVSGVNATLTSGETVHVKVPSEKLHVNGEFTLNASESAHFVYDVNVVETGGGMYILKPVVGETGLNLPVREVAPRGSAAANASASGSLSVSLPGTPAIGENVTATVTRDGSPVANATVTVNGDVVGETTADGTVTFAVEDAAKLRIVAESDDARAKLVVDLDVTADGGTGDGTSTDGDGSG